MGSGAPCKKVQPSAYGADKSQKQKQLFEAFEGLKCFYEVKVVISVLVGGKTDDFDLVAENIKKENHPTN